MDPSDSSSILSPPQARISLSTSDSSSEASTKTAAPQQFKVMNPAGSFARAAISSTMVSKYHLNCIQWTCVHIICHFTHLTIPQNKDACYTYVHMAKSHHADLFEDFCKDKLPADDIYVPEHLQPINPEEEDDVVPNQHAAFGVQKATQRVHEPAWKDLGLKELMARGPSAESKASGGGKRRGGPGSGDKGLPR